MEGHVLIGCLNREHSRRHVLPAIPWLSNVAVKRPEKGKKPWRPRRDLNPLRITENKGFSSLDVSQSGWIGHTLDTGVQPDLSLIARCVDGRYGGADG